MACECFGLNLDVFDSLGSRPYNENKTAQQILTERKAELKDLNKPEEENLIALLEGREIDPQYILQKSIGETTSGLSAQTSV